MSMEGPFHPTEEEDFVETGDQNEIDTLSENESEGEYYPEAVEEIKSMELNFSPEEYQRVARTEATSQRVSEDAFLYLAQALAQEDPNHHNPVGDIGTMGRILMRDSMKDSPKLEVFKRALRSFATKHGARIKL